MKIGVCSLSIGDKFKNIVKYGIKSKQMYCNKHKYDFIDDESVYDSTRPPAWSKILLLEKYLPKYDYLVWIDGDTYIMNDEIKLEDLIKKLNPDDLDLMIANDYIKVNTGVFFLKNTPFSIELLKEIYKLDDFVNNPKYGDYEQDSYIFLYNNNWKNMKNKVKVIEWTRKTEFNSYWYDYLYGQFILHFAGCRISEENDKRGTLNLCMTKFCPIRKDEDTDETYNERMRWLKEESRKEADRMLGQQQNI
jgi:hypothetical protein